jgi:hypothetical protein
MLAAAWTRDNPGPFVDTEGAAEILGVTPPVRRAAGGAGRLPWLPKGRSGGQPTRVYGGRRSWSSRWRRKRASEQPVSHCGVQSDDL